VIDLWRVLGDSHSNLHVRPPIPSMLNARLCTEPHWHVTLTAETEQSLSTKLVGNTRHVTYLYQARSKLSGVREATQPQH